VTSSISQGLAQKPISIAASFHAGKRLQQKANGDSALLAFAMFQSQDGGQKFSAGGRVVTVGKGDNQPHSEEVVRHAGDEIETVSSEVDHLTHVLDLGESHIERPHMHRQSDL